MGLRAREHELTHIKIFGAMIIGFFVGRQIFKQEANEWERGNARKAAEKYLMRVSVGQ